MVFMGEEAFFVGGREPKRTPQFTFSESVHQYFFFHFTRSPSVCNVLVKITPITTPPPSPAIIIIVCGYGTWCVPGPDNGIAHAQSAVAVQQLCHHVGDRNRRVSVGL